MNEQPVTEGQLLRVENVHRVRAGALSGTPEGGVLDDVEVRCPGGTHRAAGLERELGAVGDRLLVDDDVQPNSIHAVGIGDVRGRESRHHVRHGGGQWLVLGHEVQLDVDILVQRARPLGRGYRAVAVVVVKDQVDRPIAVGVDAAGLPAIEEPVTIGVGRSAVWTAPEMVGGPPRGPQVAAGISNANSWLVNASFDHMTVRPPGVIPPNVNGSQSRFSVRCPAVGNELNTAPVALFSWYILKNTVTGGEQARTADGQTAVRAVGRRRDAAQQGPRLAVVEDRARDVGGHPDAVVGRIPGNAVADVETGGRAEHERGRPGIGDSIDIVRQPVGGVAGASEQIVAIRSGHE